ncbi:MAG: hypothetical protein AAGG38_06620 [Planctomycetota bacterium]
MSTPPAPSVSAPVDDFHGENPPPSGPVLRADTPSRGVVVSCYRWGPGEWDNPETMPALLAELRSLGVDAIQIHPYAQISRDGAVTYRPGPVTPATVKPLRWARERGLSTLLKPHLAYWGSGFAWRGDITFTTEDQWQRFFRTYTDFIVHQARLAAVADADLFAVGTELHLTLHREADWRRVIAQVRAVYPGRLTYAANWNEYADVPFWDALDYVGVQAYFPLSPASSPTDQQLIAGWQPVRTDLRALSARHQKPVLLTELGYAVSEAAAREPWSDALVGDPDAAAQLKLRCMRIALEQIADEPVIHGVYLWKWFPGNRDHADEFVLQYDPMRRIIRSAWQDPAADPR